MYIKNENFSEFYEVLNVALNYSKKEWKDVTFERLKSFIDTNLKFITQQTQNVPVAQELQKKLHKLSDIVNLRFKNSSSPIQYAAHRLAFEIMGIAQGIFSEEDNKYDYTSFLPVELRQKIYIELMASGGCSSKEKIISLKPVRLVSKIEATIAIETKIIWINNENINLYDSGCETIQKAIDFIKNNKNLYCANLFKYFLYVEDLKKLQDCTWIQHLVIASYGITDEGLKFLNKMPLQSVDFSWCSQLTDKALEYLKGMPLQNVSFGDCDKLTDKALESLVGMQLKSVAFSNCPLLTDKALKYLKGMPLENVDFSGCSLLTDECFEYLKEMKLQRVNFRYCRLITDKALKYLKDMPIKRENIHLGIISYC